eukprot:11200406-Alexandrium_andersonii.AAC.1
MSASLVGSEMCIRDRGEQRQLWEVRRQLGKARRHLWELPRTAPPAMPLTVSYTHLTLPTICSV